MVEYHTFNMGVVGSRPTARITGAIVQLARTPACHAGNRGFDPRWSRYGAVAQLDRAAVF